jgi:hypothetical protein
MSDPEADEPRMTRTYAAVLGVEVLVLLTLWAVGRYFASA